jgi:rRNA-processing protein FCF1
MKIIVDTNFVLTCVKQKIDFVNLSEQLFDDEMQFFVPEEVLKELVMLVKRKGEKTKDKEAAKLSIKILENLEKKGRINKVKLENDNVDNGLVDYAKMNSEEKFIIASLDKDLKKRVKNKILTIKGKKMLSIE